MAQENLASQERSSRPRGDLLRTMETHNPFFNLLHDHHHYPPTKPAFTLNVNTYSDLFLPEVNDEFVKGNKIILHASVLNGILMACGNREDLPQPLVFRITAPTSKISHVGVLQYTSSEPNQAFLPSWLMDNLGIQDGATVALSLCTDLPRVTSVMFQPEPSFCTNLIPTLKQTLEHAVRNYVCFTQGDVIEIQTMLSGQKHRLTITHLECGSGSTAGIILDSDVNVDFETTTTSTDLSAISDNTTSETIALNQTVTATIPHPTESRFYECPGIMVEDMDMIMVLSTYQIIVTSLTGDADLYVSFTQPKPGPLAYTWKSITSGTSVVTVKSEKKEPKRCIYISVVAYEAPTTFSLQVTRLPVILSSSIPSSISSSSSSTVLCSHCNQNIPTATFQLHILRCERENWKCETCQQILRSSLRSRHQHCNECGAPLLDTEKKKHMNLEHTDIPCPDCVQLVSPRALLDHQKDDCPQRPVLCQFCDMQCTFQKQAFHEWECGSRTVKCELCDQMLVRKNRSDHDCGF